MFCHPARHPKSTRTVTVQASWAQCIDWRLCLAALSQQILDSPPMSHMKAVLLQENENEPLDFIGEKKKTWDKPIQNLQKRSLYVPSVQCQRIRSFETSADTPALKPAMACQTLQPRPERLSSSVEQRPKGMIKCLCRYLCRMGLLTRRIRTTYATTILTYARVGVWDSLMRHLCDLNCPKCGFPARNCLRGCLGYVDRNAYAWAYAMHLSPKCCFSVSLRNPCFCLHQAAIWHDSC